VIRILESVNVDIEEIMQTQVMMATPHQTVGHIRKVMADNRVSALPVVNTEKEPVGIITATDLLEDHKTGEPISGFMSDPVYTASCYDGPHIAARIMRNHHIHHVVVTQDKKVVGIVSAYDLMRFVEDHRYVAKNAPTPKNKRPKHR
jgi:CBS domain-containing protein